MAWKHVFVGACWRVLITFFFCSIPVGGVAMGIRSGLARIFVSIGTFASWHISKYPASYLGFPAHTFPSLFLYTFSLHCLSFTIFFMVYSFFLQLTFAHLALFLLFHWLVSSCFGVCSFFGIYAWVVFVLHLTSYMAGFGFLADGCDDCWCVSFLLISFPFTFSYIYFYDKINEKRRAVLLC